MAASVFKQKQNPSNVDQTIPDPDAGIDVARDSPFSVALDVLLLVEDAKAIMANNPQGGKVEKDLTKQPASLHVYEVTFKAVLEAKDVALVMGMTIDHRVKARLGGGQ